METTKLVLDGHNFGEIELYSDNAKAGKMEISVAEGLLTVYHTEVDEAYTGKGFGKILLEAMVSYAREHHLKVQPLCPYVHAQFNRHRADYQDIWDQPARS